MTDEKAWRDLVGKLLAWEDAHVRFETAVGGIPAKFEVCALRAPRIRLGRSSSIFASRSSTFSTSSVNAAYEEKKWPDDYWPSSAVPRSKAAWDESIAQCLRDRQALQKLAANPKIKLTARIPHGSGQTYLRELVLVADHNAYHVGQLVLVRQLLGIWNPKRG